ncbi:hypothetical protein MLD38_006109 [Melastoma candidum]|uniref:Uncharacterized protein n=1 Tax=Melastoma candidum TaxID=119954 RepID=A0ACB9RPW0_9MYRT|nr:hypothetical protein MLD38_006109 [Melastoma candidum]
MDTDSRTGDVDVSLNLGLGGSPPGYEDVAPVQSDGPCQVASDVSRGGSTKEEVGMEKKKKLERIVEMLLLALSGKYVPQADGFDDQRNEVSWQEPQGAAIRKRKLEYSSDEESWKRPRESNRSRIRKVYYEVDASDMSLVVNDGYQWRKYGQKVTRDNPSPRAYFKCSFAPSCPVKKKVQRSVDNPTILVANYEGEHNHRCPSHAATTSLPRNSFGSIRSPPSSPSEKSSSAATSSVTLKTKAEVLPKLSMQQMAVSLTRDPAFTTAIAGAMLNQILAQIDRE